MIKKLFLLGTLFLATAVVATPEPAQAQPIVGTWQCTWQTYCSPFGGCYTRQQCCVQECNYWTGVCVWRCEWR